MRGPDGCGVSPPEGRLHKLCVGIFNKSVRRLDHQAAAASAAAAAFFFFSSPPHSSSHGPRTQDAKAKPAGTSPGAQGRPVSQSDCVAVDAC